MKEDLLHYIWQYQEFSKAHLTTQQGEPVEILSVGTRNEDAGPDFSEAKIRMGSVQWSGSVEIHIKSSDWKKHEHHQDTAYNHVILHVVWEYDQPAYRSDGTMLPALVLDGRVERQTIRQYQQYFYQGYQQRKDLLCTAHLAGVHELTLLSALENALVSRLYRKADHVLQLLAANQGDWSSTVFQWLAQGFGFKKNVAPMLTLARATPIQRILRHQASLMELEAWLLGQAGLLTLESSAPYWQQLGSTYDFLCRKYQLTGSELPASVWKFSRMRPANFPTLRLAQWAALLHRQAHCLEELLWVTGSAAEAWFRAQPSAFWQSHYHPQRSSTAHQATLGRESIHSLVINTVVPLQFAHAIYHQDAEQGDRALNLLQPLAPEKNHVVTLFRKAGFPLVSAYDTQAALGLYQQRCQLHQCLRCSIGCNILRRPVSTSLTDL